MDTRQQKKILNIHEEYAMTGPQKKIRLKQLYSADNSAETPGRMLLPQRIQINHIFMDGIHVGWFNGALKEKIAES